MLRLRSGSSGLSLGALAFSAGCIWVALDAAGWYSSQQNIAVSGQDSIFALVLRFYAIEVLSIAVVVVGALLIYRGLREPKSESDHSSVRAIIASALSSRESVRIGVAAALAYATIYALVSSIVVYQPQVDFATAYGVSGASLNAAACCGPPGTVPTLVFYFPAWAHLAIQVLPLDALFVVVVPILVGLNVTLSAFAIRNRNAGGSFRLLGPIGFMAGLFTGCPTCAGFFLASAVGGIGATTLAVALAPLQVLFVVVSIPLLSVSPVITAFSVRRSINAVCRVPSPSETLKKS